MAVSGDGEDGIAPRGEPADDRGSGDPPTNPWWARPAPAPGAWGSAANLPADLFVPVAHHGGQPTVDGAADAAVADAAVDESRAPGWGAPDQVAPRPGRLVLVAAMLLAGLVGGGAGGVIGGVIGAHSARTDEPLVPTAAGSPSGSPSGSPPGSSPVAGVDAAAPVERAAPVSVIAARALPSVVTINVTSPILSATGSGVIIRSDGYILTNNHVIAGVAAGARVSVTLYKELRQISAEIIGRDPKTDLAVIRIQTANPLPAATLGRSGSLVVGAPLVAIGAPLGLSGTVTTGIVSALDRNPTVPVESGGESVLIGAIQTDAAINPGNSGGALVDGRGQVVGINTAIAAVPGSRADRGASGNIGVGFAIPIDYARSVAGEIISTGRATHPDVGVSTGTITPDDAAAVGTSSGALIRAVESGGPADAVGLRPGDIIIKVDGTVIGNTNDLIAATRGHRIGDRIMLSFERDHTVHDVALTLQEQRG